MTAAFASMRIRTITAHVVRLTLKQSFRHASATRVESNNLIVRCELANGISGWGEGVPRSYVTGETPDGCLEQLARTPLGELLSTDCTAWTDVLQTCEQFTPVTDRDDPRGCYGNALQCAVELSILDAFGQLFGEPVSEVTRCYAPAAAIASARPGIRYSAVIDSGASSLVRKSLVRRIYGFRQCKVKVGAAGDDDAARLRTIRRWIGPRMDLRVDANEAWHADELVSKVEALRPIGISCLEQPVPHAEVPALGGLRGQLGVRVMLDESLTSETDARAAIAGRTCDLFNIRLSKCGGFLASLRLAAMAEAAGLEYQLGCHPGESGILSAAGRHWGCSIRGLCYAEGSYDRHILRRGITNEDMTFGFGGNAPAISQPGLGVTINDAALRDATVKQQAFDIK